MKTFYYTVSNKKVLAWWVIWIMLGIFFAHVDNVGFNWKEYTLFVFIEMQPGIFLFVSAKVKTEE